MNPLVKHIAERAKLKMESLTSLTEAPVMQVPAAVLVQVAQDIELRENHIITLSLECSELRMRLNTAESRVAALTKLLKRHNVPDDEIREQFGDILKL